MDAVSPAHHPEPPDQDEMVAMLAALDLFEMMSYSELKFLLTVGSVRRMAQGDYLFRTGDSPDYVHVVMGGAVEIVRTTPDDPKPVPVAYITAGEAIGDMALFTGNPRSSSGRVPEYADIFTLTRADFEKLTKLVKGYGMKIATAFARRLDGFIKDMRARKRRKELAGKLKFFDLPTVVQTLVQAQQTGLLTIADGDNTPYAEVLLVDGDIERARHGILEGEEAFYQLFDSGSDHEFYFRTVEEPDADAVSRVRIEQSAMNLLMESVRLIDEFPRVQRRLPDTTRPYTAQTRDLRWEDEDTMGFALEILERLGNPKPIGYLTNVVPCSTFTLYRIAAELYESGQIG